MAVEKDGQRLWIAGAGDLLEDHLPLDEVLATVPEADSRIVLADSRAAHQDIWKKTRTQLQHTGYD